MKVYYLEKDKIPLLMGGSISIEDHYTSLAIITDKERKEKEEEFEKHDLRPVTHETIFQPKEPIELASLLERQEIKESANIRVLIQGSAGIGKSTLCQRIAHQWARGKLWPEFKAVFWIKLHNIDEKNYRNRTDIYEVIARECFLDQKFKQLLKSEEFRKNSLVLLDGYDELPNEGFEIKTQKKGYLPILDAFQEEFPHIIITSRPQTVSNFQRNIELEILGFDRNGIDQYIRNFFLTHKLDSAEKVKQKKTGKQTLKKNLKNLLIKSLCHIPINLEIFCTLALNGKGFSKNAELTTTALYEKVTDWFVRRHLINRTSAKKQDIEEDAFPQESPEVDSIFDVLQDLAWAAMELSIYHIDTKTRKIHKLFKQKKIKISQMSDLGIFRIQEGGGRFIHLTFQEFFAAKYLANLFENDPKKAEAIIAEKKFIPRFQLVMAMTAGILSEDEKNAEDFFDKIHESPRDIAETSGLILSAKCLEESPGLITSPKYTGLVQKMCSYLKSPIVSLDLKFRLLNGNNRILRDKEILSLIIEGLRDNTDKFFFTFVDGVTENQDNFSLMQRLASHQYIPIGIISYLQESALDENKNICQKAIFALREIAKTHEQSVEKIIQTFIEIVKNKQHHENSLREAVVSIDEIVHASDNWKPVFLDAVKALAQVSKQLDLNQHTRMTAIFSLLKFTRLNEKASSEVIKALVEITTNKELGLHPRKIAATALQSFESQSFPTKKELLNSGAEDIDFDFQSIESIVSKSNEGLVKILYAKVRNNAYSEYERMAAIDAIKTIDESRSTVKALDLISNRIKSLKNTITEENVKDVRSIGAIALLRDVGFEKALNLLIEMTRMPNLTGYPLACIVTVIGEIALRDDLKCGIIFKSLTEVVSNPRFTPNDWAIATAFVNQIIAYGKSIPIDLLDSLVRTAKNKDIHEYSRLYSAWSLSFIIRKWEKVPNSILDNLLDIVLDSKLEASFRGEIAQNLLFSQLDILQENEKFIDFLNHVAHMVGNSMLDQSARNSFTRSLSKLNTLQLIEIIKDHHSFILVLLICRITQKSLYYDNKNGIKIDGSPVNPTFTKWIDIGKLRALEGPKNLSSLLDIDIKNDVR